jgi:hypothetical protein
MARQPPQVETVDEEEDEHDLTNRDEALSDGEGEEGSSYGEGSEFGPPMLANLVDLGHPQCQAPTQVTTFNGAKEPCACRQSVEDCKCHARHHICYHYYVGSYVCMTDVGCGFQGHGLVGIFYTQEQVEELRHQDLEEMENLTTGMADENTYDEDESVVSPAWVSFGLNTNLDSTIIRDSPRTPMATQLRDELVETTHLDKKKTEKQSLWYGLINVVGARWIFQTLRKVQEYVLLICPCL